MQDTSMKKYSARTVLMSLVLGTSAILVAGCSNDPDLDITKLSVQTDPPDQLYTQALANMNAGQMAEAQRKFEAVDRQHPFSEYSRRALVMSTFIKYRQGDNEGAIQAGDRYMKL